MNSILEENLFFEDGIQKKYFLKILKKIAYYQKKFLEEEVEDVVKVHIRIMGGEKVIFYIETENKYDSYDEMERYEIIFNDNFVEVIDGEGEVHENKYLEMSLGVSSNDIKESLEEYLKEVEL